MAQKNCFRNLSTVSNYLSCKFRQKNVLNQKHVFCLSRPTLSFPLGKGFVHSFFSATTLLQGKIVTHINSKEIVLRDFLSTTCGHGNLKPDYENECTVFMKQTQENQRFVASLYFKKALKRG